MNPSTLETRNQAFHQHRNSGRLGEQQKRIMRAIHESNALHGKHDHSLREICAMTGLPVNAVSGRVNELKKEPHCLLKEAPQRKCRVTGHRVTPVIVA